MRLAECVVLANREVMPGAWLLRLAAPGIAAGARPGQMVLLRPECGPHPVLRPGLTVHRLGRGEAAFLFAADDDGSRALAHSRPGDRVTAQGPLGRGFTVDPASRHLLLVGQGLGVGPLVALADWAVGAGLAVTLLAGADSADGLLPAAMIPAEVEVRTATADGSQGRRGTVLDLMAPARETPLLLWADQVFAGGPPSLYQALRDAASATRLTREPGFCQGLLTGPLGCGLGACLGCAVETRRGTIYLCKHGPVLSLDDMLL